MVLVSWVTYIEERRAQNHGVAQTWQEPMESW